MVILASRDGLVSPFDPAGRAGGMSWIGKLDPGNLKVKLAGSIVAISFIQLPQMFPRGDGYSDRVMGLRALFLVGAVALALADRISTGGRSTDKNETPEP